MFHLGVKGVVCSVLGVLGLHSIVNYKSEEIPKKTLFFSQQFKYVRQFSRLDHQFIEGDFKKDSEEIFLQDIDLYKLTTYLTYRFISIFWDKGLYRPHIIHYKEFNNTYNDVNKTELYQWEAGVFLHGGPLKVGTSYLDHKVEETFSKEQRWQLAYQKSLKHYLGVQYAPFKGPVHLEGRLDLNAKDPSYEDYYLTSSLGVILYFNYYINMKMRYYRLQNESIQLERHVVEYFFSYHITHYIGLMVGLSKIIYSEGESPMDVFLFGMHYFISFF